MKSLLGKPQTILASLYTPGQTWEKSASNHPDKPLQCPYGKNTFQKGGSLVEFMTSEFFSAIENPKIKSMRLVKLTWPRRRDQDNVGCKDNKMIPS